MTLRRTVLLAPAVVLGLLAAVASPARATLMSTAPVSVFSATQPTDFTTTLTLPTFDTSLGTLVQVDLTFSSSGTVSGTVTNNSGSDQTFKITETTTLTLDDTGSNLGLNIDLTTSKKYTAVPTGRGGYYGPGSPASNSPFTPSATSGLLTYTSGAVFNEFNGGPGSIVLSLSTLTNTSIAGGGGNISASISTQAQGTATVVYEYNPVVATPEPSTLVMGSALLIPIAVSIVRRRKTA